jgi:hypothetical protein
MRGMVGREEGFLHIREEWNNILGYINGCRFNVL